MKDQLRLGPPEVCDMSARVLSRFHDLDLLYKDERLNMDTLHLHSLLGRKAAGARVSASALTSDCSSTHGYFRRNSASSVERPDNGNKSSATWSSGGLESSVSATFINNDDDRFRERAGSDTAERTQQKPGSQINSTRYKTELCRPFEENGACKYGDKCQFAHGHHELRSLSRHPKYKTEPCRTFHTIGFCPYGPRCHFIHNAEERRAAPANSGAPPGLKPSRALIHRRAAVPAFRDRPKLQHSLSFSGFSTQHGPDSLLIESPTSRTPPPPSSSTSSNSNSSGSNGAFFQGVLLSAHGAFSSFGTAQDQKVLLDPLAVHAHGGSQSNLAYYGNFQTTVGPPSPHYDLGSLQALHGNFQTTLGPPSPPYNLGSLQALQGMSESPVFDSPPSPPDSVSDQESYASGSLSSSGSLSGSESPSSEAGRRLPIFSRLSISED